MLSTSSSLAVANFRSTTPTSNPQTIDHRPAVAPSQIALLTAAVALLACTQTQAQTPPTRPDAGSVLQQQGSQPLELPLGAPRVLPPVFTPKPELDALPSATVLVRSFSFSGNTVFSTAQLLTLVTTTTGTTATLATLNEAAGAIRQFYRARGYLLAQAYLPRQDVTSGNIEITVLEGSLGRARVTNSTTSTTSQTGQPSRLRPSFAQGVLDARAAHPESSLADLYDPITMPPDLTKAHQKLDAAVDAAYFAAHATDGAKKTWRNDAERVAFLFTLYQKFTSFLPTDAATPKRLKKRNQA